MTLTRAQSAELIRAARRRPASHGPVTADDVDARLRAVFLRAALARARRRLLPRGNQ